MKAMRTLLACAAAVGLAALAACSHEQASLGLNPDYRFGYDDKGETAALAYGRPNSDELALMLECPKGSGKVELSDTVFDQKTKAIELVSDGRKTTVPVQAEATEGPADQILMGHLSSSAPALQALRRSGVLRVANGGKRYTITVAPEQRAGVERFFKECG